MSRLASLMAEEAVSLVRGPALCTLFLYGVAPAYFAAVERWPFSDYLFFSLVTVVEHALLYFAINGFFFLCDKHKFLNEYKIDRAPAQIPSSELVANTLREAVKGQVLVQPLSAMLLWHGMKALGSPGISGPLPSAATIFFTFALSNVLNRTLFYLAHRMLHAYPYLYATVHKQHHQYKGSIGFAAEYAHPFEQVLANQLPTLAGCLIMGAHPLVWWCWLAWRLEETYEAHSGYSFKGTWLDRIGLLHADAALYHDFHHTRNVGNYGSAILDYLGNSESGWAEYMAEREARALKPKDL